MNRETKQLALIATFCFFPTALAGWWFYGKSQNLALIFFRLSIFFFLLIVLIAGLVVVMKGGQLIKPMGSFF